MNTSKYKTEIDFPALHEQIINNRKLEETVKVLHAAVDKFMVAVIDEYKLAPHIVKGLVKVCSDKYYLSNKGKYLKTVESSKGKTTNDDTVGSKAIELMEKYSKQYEEGTITKKVYNVLLERLAG